MVDEAQAEVLARLFVRQLVLFTSLNVLVLPSGQLVGLALGQPPGARGIVKGGSNEAAADQIDGVVVAQIHGRPPDPASVRRKEELELGEAVAHEESLEDGIGGMKRRESTKRKRGIGEVGGVQIDAENCVDTSQSSGRSGHAVGGGDESVFVLIPWRRAGEDELNGDTEDAHPAKGTRENWRGSRCGEDEDDERAHSGCSKVDDAVGKPSQDIQNRVLVGGEDVGKVGAVQNVFQSGQDSNPDVRTILGRDKSAERDS